VDARCRRHPEFSGLLGDGYGRSGAFATDILCGRGSHRLSLWIPSREWDGHR